MLDRYGGIRAVGADELHPVMRVTERNGLRSVRGKRIRNHVIVSQPAVHGFFHDIREGAACEKLVDIPFHIANEFMRQIVDAAKIHRTGVVTEVA